MLPVPRSVDLRVVSRVGATNRGSRGTREMSDEMKRKAENAFARILDQLTAPVPPAVDSPHDATEESGG